MSLGGGVPWSRFGAGRGRRARRHISSGPAGFGKCGVHVLPGRCRLHMAYIWGGLGNGSGPIGGEGLSQLGHRARGVAVRVQKGSVPILCRSGEGCLGRGLGRVGGEGHEGISALGRPGSVSVGRLPPTLFQQENAKINIFNSFGRFIFWRRVSVYSLVGKEFFFSINSFRPLVRRVRGTTLYNCMKESFRRRRSSWNPSIYFHLSF